MNYYNQRKNDLREEAQEYQRENANNSLSWFDIAFYNDYFTEQAKKYGLVREFKQEGII